MALGRAGRPDSRFQMAPTRSAASVWAAFWISRHQFPMVAQTVLLGGHVRVGLEDNLYLEKGVFAPDNAALVEKRSEEHTSELQSLMRISYAVFCLKKKKLCRYTTNTIYTRSTQL